MNPKKESEKTVNMLKEFLDNIEIIEKLLKEVENMDRDIKAMLKFSKKKRVK